jgi:hypothetical protein
MNESTHKPLYIASEIINKIDAMAYEMKDDRNDGWIKLHYRNALHQVALHLDKVLKK